MNNEHSLNRQRDRAARLPRAGLPGLVGSALALLASACTAVDSGDTTSSGTSALVTVIDSPGGGPKHCWDWPKQRTTTTKRNDPIIDASVFAETWRNVMDDRGMGHAMILKGNQGEDVVVAETGWAVSPCDAKVPTAFKVNTQTKVGSVSKVITAVATLKAAEEGLLGPNQGTIDDIEETVWPALPARWTLLPDFPALRWSEILGHRAGWRKNTGVPLRERLSIWDPNTDPPRGVWNYSNALGAAGLLLFSRIDPEGMAEFERVNFVTTDDAYEDDFRARSMEAYGKYIRQKIFLPAGAPNASCRLEDALDNNLPYALYYSSDGDTTGLMGVDGTRACHTGGLAISAREMANVLYAIRTNWNVLTPASVARMEANFVDAAGVGRPYLAYDNSSTQYTGGTAYLKNGAVQSYRAQIVILPHGYYAVAVTNSGDVTPQTMQDTLQDAWNAAYIQQPGGILTK